MKTISRILIGIITLSMLSFFFTGCYSKNQAIKKFCIQDTAVTFVTVHDTIIIDSSSVDTVFNDNIDSIFIIKNKIQIKYIKIGGKIELAGKYLGDTFYKTTTITVRNPCVTKKLSWWEQFCIDYGSAMFLAILVLLILFLFLIKTK